MSTSIENLRTIDHEAMANSFHTLPSGQYNLEYHDSTHLKSDEWLRIGKIDVPNSLASLKSLEEAEWSWNLNQISSSFTFKTDLDAKLVNEVSARIVLDQVAQCLIRAGLLSPVISDEVVRQVTELQNQSSVIIIPDTNALSNGTVQWLLSSLRSVNCQLVPITISMHQIQEFDRRLKALTHKEKFENLGRALRLRSSSNNSLSMLDICAKNYQVLEVPPELLRYVRPSSGKTGEQDETDVLEDRLLIEAVHKILRSTRSRSEKVVVTADVMLSRILYSEAIPFLSALVPTIQNYQTFSSVRFDPLSKCFKGSPLARFLWIFLQTFSEVRLTSENGEDRIRLNLYWPGKTFDQWRIHSFGFNKTVVESPETVNRFDVNSTIIAAEVAKADPVATTTHFNFSNLAAPNISMLPILQLAAVISEGAQTYEALIEITQKRFAFSQSQLENAGGFLLKAHLMSIDNEMIVPTNALAAFDNYVNEADLDNLSNLLLQNFPPYRILFEHLKHRGSLPTEMDPAIKDRWHDASKVAYRNLRQFLVYLGQAFMINRQIVDGSARPSDEEFRSDILEVFADSDFFEVGGLIQQLSTKRMMSPWAVKRQLERMISSAQLNMFRFDSATPSEFLLGDKIVSGPASNPSLESLNLSAISVGGKPIYTVARAY